jgi:hypothetical protein
LLAGQLGIRQPASNDLRTETAEALCIRHHFIIGVQAIIEPKRLFVNVAEQVKRFNRNIGTTKAALEQGPEGLRPPDFCPDLE